MKIGDRVYVHGHVDEIRKDTIIIQNSGGYFGTDKSEIVVAQKREDIVNVIRCKDCKHHKDEEPGMVYCPKIVGGWVEEKCYCSWAEPKEEKR